MASVEEQETTITGFRKGSEAGYYIWTADPVQIRALNKRVAKGQAFLRHAGEDWADYSVPAEHYDPVTGFRRARPQLSDAERALRGERLRKSRNPS